MKIQNTQDYPFAFEGITIPPKGIVEVDVEIGNRLLALWWHRGLELVEETPQKSSESSEQVSEQVDEKPEKQTEEQTSKAEFVCGVCQKSFKNEKGLRLHKIVKNH